MTGYTVLEVRQGATYERYYIGKALPTPQNKQVAMVISNPGLEELLSPLGFVLGAVLEGMKVISIFRDRGQGVEERV